MGSLTTRKDNSMKKKRDRKDKLIEQYKKDVEELMEKHNFQSFLTCLRIAKMAFITSYHGRNKTFLKGFYKMDTKDTVEFLDNRIIPVVSWVKPKV